VRAHCLNGLGLVAIDAGRSDEAEELVKTAVAICEETRNAQAREVFLLDVSFLPQPRAEHPFCINATSAIKEVRSAPIRPDQARSGAAGAAATITLSDEAGHHRAAADGREWAGSNDRQQPGSHQPGYL
jgi:hypothetical protein